MLNNLIPWTRTLVTSTTAAATGNSGAIDFPDDLHSAAFIFDVTAASGTSPTLDFAIQVTPDDGTTFYTAFRPAQIVAAAIHRLVACFFGGSGNTGTTGTNASSGNAIVIANTGGALSAGSPISKKIRVLWTIGGTNPSFTFAVHVIGRRATSIGSSY